MTSNSIRLAAAVLVLYSRVESTDPPEGTFSAAVTDPSGDGGSADVISATLDIAGGEMRVRIVLTPASFQAQPWAPILPLTT
jgi:hypothetical protein